MDVDHEVQRLTETLSARHPLFSPQTVERLVTRIFADFEGASVTTYLPILVARTAEAQLQDLDHDFVAPGGRPQPRTITLPDTAAEALSR